MKKTTVLFGYKNSIYYISMLLLYIFMIFNIIFMLNETHVNILLILFVLSIYILIYFISKIGGIFLTTTKYRRLLIYKYYEDCKKFQQSF